MVSDSPPLTEFGLLILYLSAMPIDTLGSEEIDFLIRDNLQPKIVRAPEVILGYKLSTAMDIWSVGCLVRIRYLIELDSE